MLGDRPAVLAVQTRHHPEHQPGSVPQRLVAAESRRDPIDQRAELGPPSVRIYAVSRGHRGDLRESSHNPRMIAAVAAPDQRRHAQAPHRSRSRRVGGWRGGEWFGCRSGAPAGVSPRAAFASTVAGIASVSSPRPSNRACGSPAHGLPTFFTGGIRLSRPERAWAGRRSHQG